MITLQTGDQIVRIDGNLLSKATTPQLLEEMLAGVSGPVEVTYERDEVVRTTSMEVDTLALAGSPGYVGIGREMPEPERLGVVEGLTKVFYAEASNTVVFVVMVIVLMIRPAGLFGKEK